MLTKFPDGIHQQISRGGDNLSLGEKQIVSFARVLAINPAILIMDEATANIDTGTEVMIQNALNVVSQNRTVIIIAHRLSTIKKADKIIVLESGEKIEEGNHEELMQLNGKYMQMYQSQGSLELN
jgi:ATP-binding cassette subfamily B protein